jgi:hypothetical protein
MSENVKLPLEVARDLIMPECTSGYYESRHEHNGFVPYITSADGSWYAVRKIDDGKIFVANFIDFTKDPRNDEDDYFLDEFGGVYKFDIHISTWITEVEPLTEVEFFSANIIWADDEFGFPKPISYLPI